MFPWAKSLNLLGASVSLLTNEDNDARLPHLAGLNEAGSGKVRSRQSPRNLSAVAVGSAPSSPSSCLEQLPPVSPPYLQALPLPLCTSETHPSAPHHPSPWVHVSPHDSTPSCPDFITLDSSCRPFPPGTAAFFAFNFPAFFISLSFMSSTTTQACHWISAQLLPPPFPASPGALSRSGHPRAHRKSHQLLQPAQLKSRPHIHLIFHLCVQVGSPPNQSKEHPKHTFIGTSLSLCSGHPFQPQSPAFRPQLNAQLKEPTPTPSSKAFSGRPACRNP